YFFSGPVEPYRGLEMHNPEFEAEEEEEDARSEFARVIPVYGLTQGVTQRWLRARVEDALRAARDLPDPIPASWRAARSLPALSEAFAQVHFPPAPEDAAPARRRHPLEELLRIQLSLPDAPARRPGRRAAPPPSPGASRPSR